MIRSFFRWTLRILFFPIWIWAMRRRHKRELAIARQGPICLCHPGGEAYKYCPVHMKNLDAAIEDTPIVTTGVNIPFETRINDDNLLQLKVYGEWVTVEQPKPKPKPKPKPNHRVATPGVQYTLELLDGTGVAYTKIPLVTETQEGILCTAEFQIGRTMMKVYSCVRRNGISTGENYIKGQVGPGDILKIRHLIESKPIWMGDPISELSNKRLWNIIQAMDRGTWASGSVCKIKHKLAQYLYHEYNQRRTAGKYTKKKIKKMKRENRKWEDKNCTHGRDVSKTYPSCLVCRGGAFVLDRDHLTDVRID